LINTTPLSPTRTLRAQLRNRVPTSLQRLFLFLFRPMPQTENSSFVEDF
jgi:hypothetical protein